MQQLVRYLTLDKCFRNFGKKYYIEDLVEACNDALYEMYPNCSGVKIRQVQEDIKFMEDSKSYNIKLNRIVDGRRKYYRYEDPNFSIRNQPLSENEALLLKNAISVLQRFEGNPSFEWINELAPTLNQRFSLKSNTKKIIGFDNNLDYVGNKHIPTLFNAIHNQNVLKIQYKPYNEEMREYIFHPYYLKQYNYRWFVLGLNVAEGKNTWNLALDRIVNIAFAENVKYIKDDYNWEAHFDDIIGATYPDEGEIQKIELHFDAHQANYIKTKPLHSTQKNYPQEDGSLKVTFEVIPNKELYSKILSFGESVTVLNPPELRKLILNKLNLAIQKYK